MFNNLAQPLGELLTSQWTNAAIDQISASKSEKKGLLSLSRSLSTDSEATDSEPISKKRVTRPFCQLSDKVTKKTKSTFNQDSSFKSEKKEFLPFSRSLSTDSEATDSEPISKKRTKAFSKSNVKVSKKRKSTNKENIATLGKKNNNFTNRIKQPAHIGKPRFSPKEIKEIKERAEEEVKIARMKAAMFPRIGKKSLM